MRESTKATVENGNGSGDKGVAMTTFVVVIGFIVMFVAGAAGYLVVNDRVDALDAHRIVEIRKQRDGLKLDCEENYKNHAALVEWIRQQPTTKPPPTIMVPKTCTPITPVEIDSKEKH
jgi:hypothetical protein